jgi:hypothetical protein
MNGDQFALSGKSVGQFTTGGYFKFIFQNRDATWKEWGNNKLGLGVIP